MVTPQFLLIALAATGLWFGGKETGHLVKKAGVKIVHVVKKAEHKLHKSPTVIKPGDLKGGLTLVGAGTARVEIDEFELIKPSAARASLGAIK